MSEPVTFMHLLQGFLVEVARAVPAALPEAVQVQTAGRTIVRFSSAAGEFGVRLRIGLFEDDMWPHIEAVVEHAGQEEVVDVHPDSSVAGHVDAILDALRTRSAFG